MSAPENPAPVLAITVTGADADGNEVTARTVVQGARPAAGESAPAEVTPETQAGEASFPGVELVARGGMEIRVPEEVPEAVQPEPSPELARVQLSGAEPQPMSQPVQIPGLGNATGHNSAVPVSKPPLVTQVQRSSTLFKCTGGFR